MNEQTVTPTEHLIQRLQSHGEILVNHGTPSDVIGNLMLEAANALQAAEHQAVSGTMRVLIEELGLERGESAIATIRDLFAERDRLRLEAQSWAQEARSQRTTVHTIYQHVTDGTGEPGDWNGAQPAIQAINRLKAERDCLRGQVAELSAYLGQAIEAGEYVVRLCEADLEAGRSPSPSEKSAPSAALAHCYAAMNFLPGAREALNREPGAAYQEPDKDQTSLSEEITRLQEAMLDIAYIGLGFALANRDVIGMRRDIHKARRDLLASLDPDCELKNVNLPFQERVDPWLLECFGQEVARDPDERNYRFLEEALELVQACGASEDEAHALVRYVYGRETDDPVQEVGGVMVTLAALCSAHGIELMPAAESELVRIWGKIDAIREKQASKPNKGPLPGPDAEGM